MRLSVIFFFLALLVGCNKNTIETHIENGKAAMASGDDAAAVIEFKNAIRISPNDATARFLLGKAYLTFGQYTEAEKELERALEYQYPTKDVVPLLSEVYKNLGNDKSLHQLINKAQGLTPRELAKLKFYQTESYVRSGQHRKARNIIRDIKRLPESGEYGQLALAFELLLSNKLDGAILQLEQLLVDYPSQKNALKLKADLHLRNQQPAKAALTFQHYVNVYTDDDEAKLALARLYVDLTQLQEAEGLVDVLLVKYPQVPLLLQLKSSIRLRLDGYLLAYQYAEQALVINPEDDGSRLIAGMSAYLIGDKKNAHRHLALIAGILPKSHPALRLLADSQLAMGMTLEANETAKQFEQLTEQDATLLSKVGQALYRQGEITKAKDLVAQQPENLNSPKALTNAGILKLSLNDISGIIDIEKAVESLVMSGEPLTSQQLQGTLAQAYLEAGQFDKALSLADTWLNTDNLKFNGFVLQAKVFTKQQAYDKAKTAYQQALSIIPEHPAIKFSIIELTKPNSKATAQHMLSTLNEFIADYPDFIPAVTLHYMLGKRLGVTDTMAEHLRSRIAVLENNKDHQITLAKIHSLEGRFKQAIILYETVKTQTPEPFWSQLATAYIQNKEYDKVTTLYKDWFAQMPNHPLAITGQIKIYQAQGEVAQALALSTRYVDEIGGQDIELLLVHLQLLSQNRQFEQASRFLASLPQNLTTLPFVKGITGQLQLVDGKAALALDNLEAAYQANPSPQNASFMVGALNQVSLDKKASSTQKALPFLKTHLANQPNDIVNTLRYADMLLGINNDEAIIYYQKVLVLQSDHVPSLNNLAYLLDQQGQIEQAYQYALQAVKLAPNNVDILDTLGVIELKLGKNSSALQHLNKVYDLDKAPYPDVFIVNYVDALYRNGQNKLAERRLSQHKVTDKTQQQRLDQLIAKYR